MWLVVPPLPFTRTGCRCERVSRAAWSLVGQPWGEGQQAHSLAGGQGSEGPTCPGQGPVPGRSLSSGRCHPELVSGNHRGFPAEQTPSNQPWGAGPGCSSGASRPGAGACACELRGAGPGPCWAPAPRPPRGPRGHLTGENTETKISRSEAQAAALRPRGPLTGGQEPGHRLCPHGWTWFCPWGQDGRERVSAAVAGRWSASLGRAASRRKCVPSGQVLGQMPTSPPSTAPSPALLSAPCTACRPRVSWASDALCTQLWAAQARRGMRELPWLTAGLAACPARSLQKAPCWSAPLPQACQAAPKPLTELWVVRHGAASCRGRDKSGGTLQRAQGRPACLIRSRWAGRLPSESHPRRREDPTHRGHRWPVRPRRLGLGTSASFPGDMGAGGPEGGGGGSRGGGHWASCL